MIRMAGSDGAAARLALAVPNIKTAIAIQFMKEDLISTVSAFVLRAEDVTKQVTSPEGTLTILNDVSLAIPAGETVALVGASGAGKSTLLAILAGLDEPSTGRVWLNGIDITALDEDGRAAVRARQVGFVFQSFHLVPSLTAIENVMLPLELLGNRNAHPQALEVLEKVGLTARARHYPRQLSGGEQQRVAIARAFVTRPPILFADEPTGNLDAATGERIIKLLFDLNAETRATLVLVTHDQELAARCQRIVQIDAGRIVDANGQALTRERRAR
jgi:putative ABC transport system ATP-binding protein